mmetsp:Transcript_100543/g.174573  ORF Transcript_100543/g.174573 Transcript_100543/m.174573 type:complete len:185 (-) Transcript_100543:209-763(-)
MALVRTRLTSLIQPCSLSFQVRGASSAGNRSYGTSCNLGILPVSTASRQCAFRQEDPQMNKHLPIINGKSISFPGRQPSTNFIEDSQFGMGAMYPHVAADTLSKSTSDHSTGASGSEDAVKFFEVPQSREIAARLFHDIHKRAYEARRRLALARLRSLQPNIQEDKPQVKAVLAVAADMVLDFE